MKKLLSIVIPVWNRENEIIRALESVKNLVNENKDDVELIISDNNSDDNTVIKVKEWAEITGTKIKLLESSANVGPVNNWIMGLNAANSAYSLLLFSDDCLKFEEDTHSLLEKIRIMNGLKIAIARLPVRLVDAELIETSDSLLRLNFSQNMNSAKYETMTSDVFLANHLLPRWVNTTKFKRSFSPVSPSAYILSTENLLESLKRFRSRHTFAVDGAGIDHLCILLAANTSNLVACFSDPTSYLVASETSITRLSQKDRMNAIKMLYSYSYAALIAAGYFLKSKTLQRKGLSVIILTRFLFHSTKLNFLKLINKF